MRGYGSWSALAFAFAILMLGSAPSAACGWGGCGYYGYYGAPSYAYYAPPEPIYSYYAPPVYYAAPVYYAPPAPAHYAPPINVYAPRTYGYGYAGYGNAGYYHSTPYYYGARRAMSLLATIADPMLVPQSTVGAAAMCELASDA